MTVVFRHGGLRLYLLGLLAEAPRHGYEVIVELENRFLGSYSPSAGTVYPRLAKLEAEGLLEHEDVAGRKVYRITESGRAELAEHIDELQDVMREVSASAAQAASELRREVSDSAAALREELLAAARDARRTERRVDRVDARADRERARAGGKRAQGISPEGLLESALSDAGLFEPGAFGRGFPFAGGGGTQTAELRDFTRAVGRLTQEALRRGLAADPETLRAATARLEEITIEVVALLERRD